VRHSARPSFGAIFDWDGVIIDSAKLHEQSWHQLARQLGKPISAENFIRGFGMKSAQIIATIHHWATEPEDVAGLAERKEALYRELVSKSDIQPLPGVVEWLHRLHQASLPCAVASSTERANIEALLHRIGLEKAFDAIVSAEDVSHGKPDPEVFLTAAARLKLEPQRCLVFEDAYVGIEAGHAAGMKVIAVTTTHTAEELRAANLVVRQLDELSLEQAAELLLQG
jgi:beta-phosphoglucomutase family hydrolase